MKSFAFPFVFLLLVIARAGAQTDEMPVKFIPQVKVTKSNRDYFSDDQTTLSLSRPILPYKSIQNISYLLGHESPVMVKGYGAAGSLVSISLHGTGSNHTQVSWNGFPVNSPSTGQADLSLIPASFMQSVDIVNGASGALFGSGTFGGSVNLGNIANWNNRFSLEYSLDAGSYGSIGHLISLKTGGRSFQYHLAFISGRSENDFKFNDTYKSKAPEVTASHNAYKSLAFMQNFYFNLGRGNYIEGGMWYQHKTKEIPSLMGSFKESNAEQADSLFRSYISFKKVSEKSVIVVKSAWFSDFLLYTDKSNQTDSLFLIHSSIGSGRLMNEASYRYYLGPSVSLGGGLTYNNINGISNNYGGTISENEFGIFGSLKVTHGKWIMNTSLRKEFYEDVNPRLQVSGGIRFHVSDRIILRTAISNKFRRPTFNEKYWIPGGNPNLNPERGWGGEISGEWLAAGDHNTYWLEFLLTAYYQNVQNWIQWVVRDSLVPVEYKKVQAGGFDSRINFGFPAGLVNISGSVNYGFNRSVIADTYDHNPQFIGSQLMYVPLHVGRIALKADYKSFTAGGYTTFTGRRSTVETEDASLSLPAYALIDVFIGFNSEIYKSAVGFYMRVENLCNTQYQAIRSYAMPGRSFYFTLTIGLERNNTEAVIP